MTRSKRALSAKGWVVRRGGRQGVATPCPCHDSPVVRRAHDRWILTGLAVACMAACAVPAHAATLSIENSPLVVEPDRDFEVRVQVDSVQNLRGFFFTLAYNNEVVEFVSAAEGTLTQSWTIESGVLEIAGAPVAVAVAGSSSTERTGSGTLAVLTFHTTPITGLMGMFHFQAAELNDGSLPVTTSDAQVTVVGALAELYVGVPGETLRGAMRQQVTVPVFLDADASGVLGYYLEIQYDSRALTFAEAFTEFDEGGTVYPALTAPWGPPEVYVDDLTPAMARLRATSSGLAPISGGTSGGVLVYLRFDVRSGPVGYTDLRFISADLNDGAIMTTTHDGRLLVEYGLPLRTMPIALTMFMIALAVLRRKAVRRGVNPKH